MKKSDRRQTKLPTFDIQLDHDEFNALTDVLFELVKENHSQCARLLGISRPTWKKWETQPPTWPWWNLVLREIIKHYITGLHARRGFTAKHRRTIMDLMQRIPQGDEFVNEIDQLAYNVDGCANHLRATLGGKGMFFDELRTPALCGGYSPSTLRRAAKMIGVVKTQEGYRDKKRSYWRLSTEDD
jgi:hypothetical protein